MKNYMNNELKDVFASMQVKQGTSKDGNIYYCLEITLINGHKYLKFLRGAEEFAFCNAFDLLATQKQVDANFNN